MNYEFKRDKICMAAVDLFLMVYLVLCVFCSIFKCLFFTSVKGRELFAKFTPGKKRACVFYISLLSNRRLY